MKNVDKTSLIRTVWIFIPLLIWYGLGWAIFPYFLDNAVLPDEIEGKIAFPMMPYIIAGIAFALAFILANYYFLSIEKVRRQR